MGLVKIVCYIRYFVISDLIILSFHCTALICIAAIRSTLSNDYIIHKWLKYNKRLDKMNYRLYKNIYYTTGIHMIKTVHVQVTKSMVPLTSIKTTELHVYHNMTIYTRILQFIWTFEIILQKCKKCN